MKLLPLLSFSLLSLAAAGRGAAYDPLALPPPPPEASRPVDLTVHDEGRHRDLPVRVFLPVAASPAPVVLFSHGLGGSREGSGFLGEHWAARGYVAVYVQHPGSDTAVWKDVAPAERMPALKRAASVQNLILRLQDIPAVLDRLAVWNREAGHPLAGRLDLEHVGMSGHSFGAQTTQAVSGQSFPAGVGQRFTDARIRGAAAFSPNVPSTGSAAEAFGGVKIPWMLMTGTKDESPIGGATPASRQAVFPALPPGDKYELVLNNAEHSVFTDRALPGETGQRNPNHHRVILALTTAFWDAYLKGSAEAKAWLEGEGPRSVLEKEDRWQRK